MRDFQKYWQEIRTLAAELPPYIWLVSLDDPKRGMRGGSLVEVTAETAAKLLHNNSHRRATDEELATHCAAEAEAQRSAFHDRLRVKGVTVVAVGKATPEKKPAVKKN
jgi:hypothetical protein